MTSIGLPFEPVRHQSPYGGVAASPAPSPRLQRPASSAPIPQLPQTAYSPSFLTTHDSQNAYAYRQYEPYQHHAAMQTPVFDARMALTPTVGSVPMIRTISHAHPMSSGEMTMPGPTRYSPSSHHQGFDTPATASMPIQPYAMPHPPNGGSRHGVDPNSIFALPFFQSMSRSTSGNSDGQEMTRLMTPQYDPARDHLSPVDTKPRHSYDYEMQTQYWGRQHGAMPSQHGQFAPQGYHQQYAMSAERGDETDYERERETQIMNNRKLFEDVGLGPMQTSVSHGQSFERLADSQYARSRNVTSATRKASSVFRKRMHEAPGKPVSSLSPATALIAKSVCRDELPPWVARHMRISMMTKAKMRWITQITTSLDQSTRMRRRRRSSALRSATRVDKADEWRQGSLPT